MQSHKQSVFQTLGRHPIHPFPARMAPGIALEALGNGKPLRVLDPMVGSGTVLAVARHFGHHAFGFDLDPLAVLIARVWTSTLDAGKVKDTALKVLSRAKDIFRSLSLKDAYPQNADEETRRFIRYWYDDYARRQLTSLSIAISRVQDEKIKDALWCGFSRLIISKSSGASLAMDLSHSRPHKTFTHAPIKPFTRFISAIVTVVSNCICGSSADVGPRAFVRQGDARSLDSENCSFDLVLTSPPYLNAIDYIRCSKFSLVWMGYTVARLRSIRSGNVGTESAYEPALQFEWVTSIIKELRLTPALAKRNHALLATYIWDMNQAVSEVSRVLRQGGRAVYVIGDCTNRGTFISNSSIVTAVAERNGLSLRSRKARNLPANRRYLPPPTNRISSAALDGRLREEIILSFNKS